MWAFYNLFNVIDKLFFSLIQLFAKPRQTGKTTAIKQPLAGRYELLLVEHWNYTEAQKAFGMTLQQYIRWGCYPGAMVLCDDPLCLASYIRDAIVMISLLLFVEDHLVFI